jgi:hypothetical protein
MAHPIAHAWGLDNAELVKAADGPRLRVHYPKGSINPGNDDAPRGGLGFRLPVASAQKVKEACLRYRVRFPEDFAFARGGKLPGLYDGTAPSGGVENTAPGFSARLMWRGNGAGEVYLYTVGRPEPYGESLERGSFTFTPGQWMEIVQHVTLVEPGMLRLRIDGKNVMEIQRNFQASGDLGLMMSTFFGGHDPSWASPRDQFADFGNFTIWLRR